MRLSPSPLVFLLHMAFGLRYRHGLIIYEDLKEQEDEAKPLSLVFLLHMAFGLRYRHGLIIYEDARRAGG